MITFPNNLSAESFADLRDHLNLFLRKMERRAKIARLQYGEIMEEDEVESSSSAASRLVG